MNSRFNAAVTLALALVFAFSCERPDSVETFVRSDQTVNGCYSFPLVLDDSLSTYSLSFYTRMRVKAKTSIPLDITVVSPSGQEYAERVYMKIGNRKGDRECYRSGFTPSEYGNWTIILSVAEDVRNFPGIGVILTRDSN